MNQIRTGAVAASLLAGVLASGCATITSYSGRTNSVQASVDAEEGRILVRPNEVAWVMGDAVSFERTYDPTEIGNFTSNGSVMAGPDTPALPNAVELAASQEVLERKADGFVVTHYVLDRNDYDSLTVRVWGRLLRMDDLGPMDEERADLRRMVDQIEGSGGTSVSVTRTSSLLVRNYSRPAPATAVPSAQKQNLTRVGVEVGTVTGLVIDVGNKSPIVDATSLRVGIGVSIIEGQGSLDIPTLAYQVEFIEDFIVQPTVGFSTAIGLYAFSSIYPTIQGLVGAEIDPAGPLEAHVGIRAGSAIGAGSAITPDISVGWVW